MHASTLRKLLLAAFASLTVVCRADAVADLPADLQTKLTALETNLSPMESWVDARMGPRGIQFPRSLVLQILHKDFQCSIARESTAGELIEMGTNAWPALPQLALIATNRYSPSYWLAMRVLSRINAQDHPAWEAAARGMTNQNDPWIVQAVVRHIEGEGWPGMVMNDADRRFGLGLAKAFGHPASERTMPPITNLLADPAHHALWPAAAGALATLSFSNTAALANLMEIAERVDEWPQVSADALRAAAILQLRDPEILRRLQTLLQDERALVRISAAEVLWKFGEPAALVRPVVVAAGEHKLKSIRAEAAAVLKRTDAQRE